MIQWFNKKLKNRKGFTLIELIVVIAILGILALIAIPRLMGFQDAANEKVADANEKLVNSLIAVYYADNNAYPTAANFDALIDALEADPKEYISSETATDLKDSKSWNGTLPTYSQGDDSITRGSGGGTGGGG